MGVQQSVRQPSKKLRLDDSSLPDEVRHDESLPLAQRHGWVRSDKLVLEHNVDSEAPRTAGQGAHATPEAHVEEIHDGSDSESEASGCSLSPRHRRFIEAPATPETLVDEHLGGSQTNAVASGGKLAPQHRRFMQALTALTSQAKRRTFAQRLRHQAWSSQICNKLAVKKWPRGLPLRRGGKLMRKTDIRTRRRIRAEPVALQYLRMVDDDSAEEEETSRSEWLNFRRMMLSNDAEDAQRIQFTTHGACLQLDGLDLCKDQSICLSNTVAMVLASGVDPSSCIALQSGRLAPLGPAQDFQLQKSNGAWILVADTHAYFNFLLRRWQPLGMATFGPYAPVADLLYVAFVPQKVRGPVHGRQALFVKLGYRELVQGEKCDHDSIIGYVEKKGEVLQLTNIPGAGIFVFDIPKSHQVFGRPGRAAEASLKTELLHSKKLTVTPSGHCGDVGAFSASLEYFFVEESNVGCGPLAVLTSFLRSFSSNASLLPQCAVASEGGGSRRGRKHLQPWPEDLGMCDQGNASAQESDDSCREPLRNVMNLAAAGPMHALRSRAKCAQLGGRVVRKAGLKGVRSRRTC